MRRMAIFGRGHGASEPGGTGEPAETPGRGRLTRSVIGWVGAVAVVVSLAGSGWCGWVLFEKHQTDVAAGQALQAARSYVVKLATMDCERIDHNMRDILEVRPASSKISTANPVRTFANCWPTIGWPPTGPSWRRRSNQPPRTR